jgi:tetratricopeptide (TPR) repeat protein
MDLSPEFANAYLQKIDIYLKWEGDTKNSRKVLEEASAVINPSSSPALAEKAVLMDIYDGQYQEALHYLNSINFEAIQTQFYFYPKYLYQAYIYDYLGDRDRAEIFYHLAQLIIEDRLIFFPDDARLYSSLGICFAGLGEKEKAIAHCKKGVELLPLSKESWRGYYRLVELAQAYVMVGEYKQAIELIDLLLSVPGILSPPLLKLETRWSPLWDMPAFVELIAKYSDN